MSGRPTQNSRRAGLSAPLSGPSRTRKGKAPEPRSTTPPSLLDLDNNDDANPDYDPDQNPDYDPDPNPDPDDDGDDFNEDDNGQDDSGNSVVGPTLADAIALLAQTLNQPRETPAPSSKVREPDQFDGSDSRKLRTFLMQLELNFNDRPTVFRRDRTNTAHKHKFYSPKNSLKFIV